MNRFTLYICIALFTFALSILGTTLVFYRPLITENIETPVSFEEKTATPKNLEITEIRTQSEPKSLSPDDIKDFIYDNPQADLKLIWKRLNISGKFNNLPDWEKDASFMEVCGYCEAETYQYNLDDEPDNEVLLRIADNSQEACRYLVFKRRDLEDTPWKLLGFIDHNFGRYRMPKHSYFVSRGKKFLIVNVQTTSGSGVTRYVDRVFMVHKERLIDLLSYPSDGHQSFLSYQGTRRFMGTVNNIKINNLTAQIEIDFNVNYNSWDEKTNSKFLLWNRNQKAVYTKFLSSETTKFDSLKSNITEKEIDIFYDIGHSTDEDILKYYRQELTLIAREKGKRNQWLRKFLEYCDSTEEKKFLEKIIRK